MKLDIFPTYLRSDILLIEVADMAKCEDGLIYSRVRIALAKNAGFSQNGSHMLLSLLASFGKTSMKQDKSKSTVACVIHFASTQHF